MEHSHSKIENGSQGMSFTSEMGGSTRSIDELLAEAGQYVTYVYSYLGLVKRAKKILDTTFGVVFRRQFLWAAWNLPSTPQAWHFPVSEKAVR